MQFSALNLHQDLLRNLQDLGWKETTPIQAQALPAIIAGRDVIGIAKTGSGKTGAFSLGLLNKIDTKAFHVQVLILCPTRELADQVTREIRRLARYQANTKILSLCGGVPLGRQIGSLRHGAHIIVGTPGRITKHIHKGTLDVSGVKFVVLDEADRMLDMGFEDEVTGILSNIRADRQTLLFSATFQPEIKSLCDAVTQDACVVDATADEAPNSIEELGYVTHDDERGADLAFILSTHDPDQAIVFCNMKVTCDRVVKRLKGLGWSSAALHGDMEQKDRELVMILFKQKSVRILVATDVAARGLDIEQLAAVVNYDLPEQPEVYIHRIGRTGRAGESGLAISLYTPAQAHRLPNDRQVVQKSLYGHLESTKPAPPKMATLCIRGGRKDKLRPGDIVGALTFSGQGIEGHQIGKIHVRDFDAFVAVNSMVAKRALQLLTEGQIKGRRFKARKV